MAVHQTPSHRPTARVGWNNRTQTVTMPPGFRFPETVREVYIRREGENVILTPRPTSWSTFFASGLKASPDFLNEREQQQPREREF
jgi:antitoxin VapB